MVTSIQIKDNKETKLGVVSTDASNISILPTVRQRYARLSMDENNVTIKFESSNPREIQEEIIFSKREFKEIIQRLYIE